uniref:Alginate export domain-containing protein n=1 Tax=Geobacter metallireducens TaxID=28232 RepID=A0A831U3D3_GEOME
MNTPTIVVALSLALAGGGKIASAAPTPVDQPAVAESVVCREVAGLARKYGAEGALPATMTVEGKPCLRSEAADCLLAIVDKIVVKYRAEGSVALAAEDRETIVRLRTDLAAELEKHHGYHTLREDVEAILAKPDLYDYEYRLGVNGFARGEGAGNFRLPDVSHAPGHGEGRFLYRVKPYLYWHPVAWFDLHAEGQGYGYRGGDQQYGKISLYQGFADIICPSREANSLRVGRQELVYGSAFMLGSNSFYQGLTFDALRLRVAPVKPLTVDFFGGWYASPWSDGVEGSIAGAYAAWTVAEGTALELYGFRDSGSDDRRSGEHRNSLGLRATARLGAVSLEAEPVWQRGRLHNGVENESINAWGGHLDLYADAEIAGLTNHFFAGAAYGSGSRAAAAGASGRKEFLNQLTDSSLTGDMGVVGDLSGLDVADTHASGLQIYALGWGIDLTKELNFSATGRYFLANYVPDGVSRRIGLETDFTLTYAMNDTLSVIAGYDRFFTGKFFRDASGSGDDIHYGYLMLQFDLSHTRPKPAARR